MGTRRLGVFLLLVAACAVHAQEPIRVGSKRFTESYILGEILAQTARGQHKAGLGNTAILVAALENDAIDVYPEYTGTIINEILRTEERLQLAEINRRLARLGLAASTPLGFSNNYALGTRRDLRAISDLTRLPELRLGFSHEFLGRRDGWPGLKAAYGLPQQPGGPASKRTLRAALFAPDSGRLLAEHLGLVFGSLVVAALIGVPLGVLAAKVGWLAQPVLALTGLVQTIPSLALLAFLIPLTGRIGLWPALIALFLYALLPITRNTHAGLAQVPRGLLQAGTALGLLSKDILYRIELPLARETIMAGVKTSAVINVGTATIAAFIGAGGFGERIAQGLALNDHTVLLAGALPAAALALAVHAAFELAERCLARRPR